MTDEGLVEPIHRVNHGWDRKLCQVQLGDVTWVAAEIRSWDRDTSSHWSASVTWTRGPGLSSRFDRFRPLGCNPLRGDTSSRSKWPLLGSALAVLMNNHQNRYKRVTDLYVEGPTCLRSAHSFNAERRCGGWIPMRKLSLGLVFTSVLALFMTPPPAFAHDAPIAEVKLYQLPESAWIFHVSRERWGVRVHNYGFGSQDDSTRFRFYWEARLMVAGAADPDVKAGPYTRQSSPPYLSDADTIDMNKPRYLYAGRLGTALQGVEIKTCLVRIGIDECVTQAVAIPDHPSHATADSLAGALQLMEVSLPQFLTARASANHSLGVYLWSQDGCSAPDVRKVNYFNRVFMDACIRHDFGYRNFGPGPTMRQWMDPRDSRRKYVDGRFLADMVWTCRNRSLLVSQLRCLNVAALYHSAVRGLGGAPAFWQMN